MDDLQQVRALRDQLPDPSHEEHHRLRQRIATAVATPDRQRRSRRFSPPRRVWVPAIAGALTIGVVLSVSLLPGDDAGSPEPAAPQLAVLQDAADQLDPDPDATVAVEIPRPDQWRYRQTAGEWVEGPNPNHEEWLRADNGLIADRDDGGELTTNDGEGVGISKPVGGAFTDLQDMYTFFQNLPADDPSAALDQIYAMVDEHNMRISGLACPEMKDCEEAMARPWARDGAAALVIDTLLYTATPPPDVQALLYRALAQIPGVEDQGTITDITGTRVLSVGWTPPSSFTDSAEVEIQYRWHTLIDPETSTYRGHLVTDPGPAIREDNLTLSNIILSSGIVDEPGQTP